MFASRSSTQVLSSVKINALLPLEVQASHLIIKQITDLFWFCQRCQLLPNQQITELTPFKEYLLVRKESMDTLRVCIQQMCGSYRNSIVEKLQKGMESHQVLILFMAKAINFENHLTIEIKEIDDFLQASFLDITKFNDSGIIDLEKYYVHDYEVLTYALQQLKLAHSFHAATESVFNQYVQFDKQIIINILHNYTSKFSMQHKQLRDNFTWLQEFEKMRLIILDKCAAILKIAKNKELITDINHYKQIYEKIDFGCKIFYLKRDKYLDRSRRWINTLETTRWKTACEVALDVRNIANSKELNDAKDCLHDLMIAQGQRIFLHPDWLWGLVVKAAEKKLVDIFAYLLAYHVDTTAEVLPKLEMLLKIADKNQDVLTVVEIQRWLSMWQKNSTYTKKKENVERVVEINQWISTWQKAYSLKPGSVTPIAASSAANQISLFTIKETHSYENNAVQTPVHIRRRTTL